MDPKGSPAAATAGFPTLTLMGIKRSDSCRRTNSVTDQKPSGGLIVVGPLLPLARLQEAGPERRKSGQLEPEEPVPRFLFSGVWTFPSLSLFQVSKTRPGDPSGSQPRPRPTPRALKTDICTSKGAVTSKRIGERRHMMLTGPSA